MIVGFIQAVLANLTANSVDSGSQRMFFSLEEVCLLASKRAAFSATDNSNMMLLFVRYYAVSGVAWYVAGV